MSSRNSEIEATAATWLAHRDRAYWTADEQTAFQAWLDADVTHRVAFLRLNAVWQQAARLKVLDTGIARGDVPPRGAWASSPFFEQRPRDVVSTGACRAVRPSQRHHRRWRWLAGGMAAVVVVAVVLVGAWFWSTASMVHHGEWQTAIGRSQVVHLADGSTVTLAGDSRIRTSLGRDDRNIEVLHGEAFFSVVHDPARPFIVHVNGYQVVDVGTRFDVRRSGADAMRVVVAHGVVRLQSDKKPGQPATDLPAGSVALIDGNTVTVSSLSGHRIRAYLSWRNGFVVFDSTPLAKAVADFNRYNTKQIVIGDAALGKLRVGGHFRLDNSDAFVRLAQQMFPIRVERHGGRIVLLRRDAGRPIH